MRSVVNGSRGKATVWRGLGLLLALLGSGAAACGSNEVTRGKLASGCLLSSECDEPLVCTFGRCHVVCNTTVDCSHGERCVVAASGNVCQLSQESGCIRTSDCREPLVCAVDGQCRNACVTERDCSPGQLCAKSGSCAEPTEVDSAGRLPNHDAANGEGGDGGEGGSTDGGMSTAGGAGKTMHTNGGAPGGSGDGGGVGGSSVGGNSSVGGSSVGGSSVGGSSVGGSSGGVGGSSGGVGGSSGGVGASAGTAGAAECGYEAESCCAGDSCLAVGTACKQGTCVTCGGVDKPCCGSICGANLTCNNGTCECGAIGQKCCGGTSCTSGSCNSGTCSCDKVGSACCAGATCAGMLQCAAATACTCATTCEGEAYTSRQVVTRGDGSIWQVQSSSAGPYWYPLKDANSNLITGVSKAAAGYLNCFVKDGNVQCWGNTQYGLGDGVTTSSATPVLVRTSIGGPALSGVTDVDVGYSTACAVAQGGVYCWGLGTRGQLGNGALVTSALPVLVVTSQGILAGVSSVAVGGSHACAVTKTGELWCWGSNDKGELGLGNTGPDQPYASQVTALASNVVQASLVAPSLSGALTKDGTAWVWGTSNDGQLGDGLASGAAAAPTQVKLNGTPLANVTKLSLANQAVYVLRSDGTLWSWGKWTGHLTPEATGAGNIFFAGVDNSLPCYIQLDGSIWSAGVKVPPLQCN
ncbi:MAG TPA: hypothetical protein VFK05_34095 [Polyangiaceae bacterium]|nr:hypothetical protein [Polyangiaceae bacterium]